MKRDKNAFRMLQMMFTAKLALYGNTYPINSAIASNQWSFNPSTNWADSPM